MAFQFDYTDASGVLQVASHFRCVQINIGASDQNISLAFYGYASLSAFATGKQPLPGAVKLYSISGAEFSAIATAAPVGSTLYDVLAHASETYALAKLDVDTGTVDNAGNKVFQSFFHNASQI